MRPMRSMSQCVLSLFKAIGERIIVYIDSAYAVSSLENERDMRESAILTKCVNSNTWNRSKDVWSAGKLKF